MCKCGLKEHFLTAVSFSQNHNVFRTRCKSCSKEVYTKIYFEYANQDIVSGLLFHYNYEEVIKFLEEETKKRRYTAISAPLDIKPNLNNEKYSVALYGNNTKLKKNSDVEEKIFDFIIELIDVLIVNVNIGLLSPEQFNTDVVTLINNRIFAFYLNKIEECEQNPNNLSEILEEAYDTLDPTDQIVFGINISLMIATITKMIENYINIKGGIYDYNS